LLDRPRQGVARHLNDHLLLASKWVFRHAISSHNVRHAIKVSARPHKSGPKPKVQRVSGPVILPNRAYAAFPVLTVRAATGRLFAMPRGRPRKAVLQPEPPTITEQDIMAARAASKAERD
jgi:hypothetical protein